MCHLEVQILFFLCIILNLQARGKVIADMNTMTLPSMDITM